MSLQISQTLIIPSPSYVFQPLIMSLCIRERRKHRATDTSFLQSQRWFGELYYKDGDKISEFSWKVSCLKGTHWKPVLCRTISWHCLTIHFEKGKPRFLVWMMPLVVKGLLSQYYVSDSGKNEDLSGRRSTLLLLITHLLIPKMLEKWPGQVHVPFQSTLQLSPGSTESEICPSHSDPQCLPAQGLEE